MMVNLNGFKKIALSEFYISYIRVRKYLFKIDYAPNLYFAHLLLCQLSNYSKIILILLEN